MKAESPEVFALSVEKKIELLGELCDSIAVSPKEIPVPAWHLEEVNRRKQEYENDPSIAIPWEDARERILRKHEQ